MNSGHITLMLLGVDVAGSGPEILRTISVTSCKAKRSFSGLCRLKTYLQSSIGENRLNGLALLHIHQDINVDLMMLWIDLPVHTLGDYRFCNHFLPYREITSAIHGQYATSFYLAKPCCNNHLQLYN